MLLPLQVWVRAVILPPLPNGSQQPCSIGSNHAPAVIRWVTTAKFWSIPIRDWDQLDIGISPIVPLGSVPMSNWDQSQSPIGINPIGINPNWTLGSIPVGFFCWHRDQFHKNFFKNLDFLEGTNLKFWPTTLLQKIMKLQFFVTAGTDLLLNNLDETEDSLFLNGLSWNFDQPHSYRK